MASVKKQVGFLQLFYSRSDCLQSRPRFRQVEQGLADGPWSLTEHGKKAELKLKTNPYDLECWNILVREAQV